MVYFDPNNSRNINYPEFIKEMRSQLSAARKLLVNSTFNEMTKGKGSILLDDLISMYNVEKHPKVLK